ncbi:hypothetical protein CLHUN_01390 [Ruminiclostridium hungatei]|uniref:Lipoprotein n=1 Tax=Ruminiclostridium hungatei TaxID=48256 RepID=A0A1V4SRB3_RUMHU|nr:hypothetical protein [Ruminiclostridium hungatei]OPX46323.1 hypothetical protein CLHUN_01390 [Ruminiclostridium hungatei]
MKQIMNLLILLSILGLALSGCGSTARQQAAADTTQHLGKAVKDTPRQIGQKGQISASIIGYSFDKSYEKADLIAEVEISEWLEEMNEPIEKTVFRASVKKILKNSESNSPEEINLLQDGNSDYTFNNYPLFKNGDKLLLFLKKAVGEKFENTYWILGGTTGVFRLIHTDEQAYAVKQVGDCPELSEAKATENDDIAEIRKILNESYSFELSKISSIPEIYNLDMVESLIKEHK